MASQVCMTVPTRAAPRSFSARRGAAGFRATPVPGQPGFRDAGGDRAWGALAGGGRLGEVPYRPHELLRGLKLREVAGPGQQPEPGTGDRSGVGTAVAGIDDPVGLAPDDQ